MWEGLFDEESMRLTGTRQTFTREAVVRHLESIGGRDDRADWAIIDLETGGTSARSCSTNWRWTMRR